MKAFDLAFPPCLATWVALAQLAGCGGGSAGVNPAQPPTPAVAVASAPLIKSFTASLSASSSLTWVVEGADKLNLTPGPGSVTGTSAPIAPTTTTTYTLTASNAAGATQAALRVSILNPAVLYAAATTYPVLTFDGYVVKDIARNRDIPIFVRYPQGAPTPVPVVIFSHGGPPNSQGRLAYPEWGNLLAGAGYAVIHMSHLESPDDSHCAPLGIPAAECSNFGNDAGTTLHSIFYHRPLDAAAVFNNLEAIAVAGSKPGAFDRSRVAIAGHSAGAFTAQASAGALVNFSASVLGVNLAIPEARCFLQISPQGIGRFGLFADSWNGITRSVMSLTGAGDDSLEEQAADRLAPFKLSPGPNKTLMYINQTAATHATFGLNSSEGVRQYFPYIESAGVAYLDACLKGDARAGAWLTSPSLGVTSGGVARMNYK